MSPVAKGHTLAESPMDLLLPYQQRWVHDQDEALSSTLSEIRAVASRPSPSRPGARGKRASAPSAPAPTPLKPEVMLVTMTAAPSDRAPPTRTRTAFLAACGNEEQNR